MEPLADTGRLAQAATWEQLGVDWPAGQEQTLVCCRVVAETHDVRSFHFRREDGAPLRFEPGQYITLALEIAGQRLARCYTVSSPPTRPFTFSITVKRVPGGPVSNWLHDHLQPGGRLQATGPAGSFTPTAHPAHKLLYLSAGSGITPLMSMLRASLDLGESMDLVFVHSARTPADIVFREELAALARLSEGLRVIAVCEALGDERSWPAPLGRLSLALLRQQVPDFLERAVFACGPEGYMRAAQALLAEAGHAPERYHQESFNIGTGPGGPDAPDAPDAPAEPASQPAGTGFTVRLAKSQKSFTVAPTQSLLAAVRQSGTAIASSCQQGVCGSCKTMLLDGAVRMAHQGGIRQREIDKGWRLLCCSYPQTDVVLDL